MTTAEIPPAEVTVSQHILGLAPGRCGRPALVDAVGGRVTSYSAFAATVRAAAAGLTRRGVRAGDVVGVYVAGAAAFAVASHAIRVAGGVPALVSPGMCGPAIAAGFADCDVRIVITDTALVRSARDVAEQSRVRQLICFGEAADTTRFDALLRSGTMRPVPRDSDDAALVAWAAGSGGSLRPLPVSHGELAADLRRMASRAMFAGWDVVVAAPPCGNGRGYCALLDLALAVGATVVGAPGQAPEDVLTAAHAHRGTVALVAPGTELPDRRLRGIPIEP